MAFTVIEGDIAAQSADALVNAAGTSLRMGSGVAGSLRRNANGPINEEAMSNGQLTWATLLSPTRTTSTPTTSSTRQNATLRRRAGNEREYSCGDTEYPSESRGVRCTSLVVPVPGTGAAGFEFETGARLICEVIRQYEPETLTDVRVIAYTTAEHETLQTIADQL